MADLPQATPRPLPKMICLPPRPIRRQPTVQPPIKVIRTRIRLVETPARMTRRPAEPARVTRQAIAVAAAPIRVQPVAVDRVQRTHPVVARMGAGRRPTG